MNFSEKDARLDQQLLTLGWESLRQVLFIIAFDNCLEDTTRGLEVPLLEMELGAVELVVGCVGREKMNAGLSCLPVTRHDGSREQDPLLSYIPHLYLKK